MWDVHYDYLPPAPYDTHFDPDYAGPVDGRNLIEYYRMRRKDITDHDLAHLVALYDGEIAWTYRHVGSILERLDELGLSENTVVILTADHGEEFFDHGRFGHKRALDEESIRIPLVVRYRDNFPSSHRISQPVQIVDIAPTILEACRRNANAGYSRPIASFYQAERGLPKKNDTPSANSTNASRQGSSRFSLSGRRIKKSSSRSTAGR